jgi:hypothetical protein
MAKATRNQSIRPAAKDNARSHQSLPDIDTALKEKLEEAISSVIGQGQRAQIVERITQVVASEISQARCHIQDI